MRRTLVALLLLASPPLLAQAPNGWAPIENGWAEIQVTAPTGTVTTTGTLAAGQVALGSGATSITGDAGLTYSGTGATFKLGIGTDVFVSRASAGLLLVEDGSGAARDMQARTGTFGTSVVTPVLEGVSDILSQKRGTNAQTFRVYKTDDGAGNAEWLESGWVPAYSAHLFFSAASGTGVARSIGLLSSGAVYLFGSGVEVNATALYPGSNNVYDLGIGASSWRTGYFGTSLYSPLFSGGPNSTGTNIAGTNVVIQPQAGTGSATGSSIVFQTPTAGGSGTTAQTQTTRLTINETVGAQWATGTRPTCDAGARGGTWYVAGGAGVADTFEVCRKDAGDAYAWVTLF